MATANGGDKEWIIAPPHPQREQLAAAAGISPLVAQLLLSRGIGEAAEVRPFLSPDFRALHDPAELPGALEAADVLYERIAARVPIVVYGDYDVDGITASAILWHAIRLAGGQAEYYVPSRFEEGYGLSAEALERLARDGAQCVISVDCGITAVAEARRARELNLTLLISDHHEPRAELPDAAVIVHPVARGVSVNPHLSGAGVALKIAWALARRASGGQRVAPEFRELLLDGTALAALGLIADVVPLRGENRVIASFGLKRLRHSTNPGVRALIEVSGLAEKSSIDDYDVGFMLAPRLNAIGRMGHARLAVEMLTRAEPAQAREIAQTLDGHNRKRQSVERRITQQAEELVRQRGLDRDGSRAIVLAGEEWHVGVVGIAAARLVDRFCRPTVLIALENGMGQGSGRSIRHFPLHEALAACERHLISHGGHAMAAGLRIRAECVEPFAEAFGALATQRLTPVDLRPKLRLDDEVELAALRIGDVEHIQQMAPFGEGNYRPRLATGVVDLAGPPRTVGQSAAHLQFSVRQGPHVRKAIAFNGAGRMEELCEQRRIRVAFEPIINEWNGNRSVELKVIDWRAAEAQAVSAQP
ncbi:MAG: Single-stranded-DNA-specific exonuclease RecJ [Phycisphaerae bacterium]|nr:Single-stranded-DNA-specific exonuclease RecJ [Phycisphaerae bacterium]